jgi:hypothetical protein
MGEIALKTTVFTQAGVDEVRQVLDDALHREADLADARRAHFERICRAFEQQYHITSDEFMQQFEAGTLGDDAEYFDWYAAKRGWDLWRHRFQILSGVEL